MPSARNFGHDAVPDHAQRYARAAEFTSVVKALWDSWEDDAFIGDQAGGSGDGRALAARHAEAVFSASQSFEEALAYARDLKSRAEALGRGPEAIRVLPGLTTIIGDTEAAARRRRRRLQPDA